jgi:histidine kinase
MLPYLRRHLVVKLFLSYLIVIIVGLVVLGMTAEAAVPSAFERHLAQMTMMMGQPSRAMEADLRANFRRAFNEALTVAAIAALLVALAVSFLVSRQIVTPMRQMMEASQHIAEGSYHERVPLPSRTTWEDLDELGRLAVSFNQMAAKLAQIEATRRELIANVAHELRTPLATIKGSMEGLIDEVLVPEPATFQQIYREADRLQRLVDDLQELSRVEAGAIELQPKPLNLATVVSMAVARLMGQFEEKGVTLSNEISPTLPQVLADEDRLIQILINLIGNGLQYTPPGGRVEISATAQVDQLEIQIKDSGIGIAPEHLPLLFTRFYRVDKSRSRSSGGSGIGLTIVKHLVEKHGGQVRAESAGEGQASTFIFTLPLADQ